MSRFRGTDDQLDREIETLERISRLRVRRAAAELTVLERDLRELRRERRRRRANALVPESSTTTVDVVD